MKKGWKIGIMSLLLAGQMFVTIPLKARASEEGIPVDKTTFADTKFRSYISKSIDRDGSGTLTDAEIVKVTEMDVKGLGIANLSGIEVFTELTRLDCSENKLKKLNVSGNKKLTGLNCDQNPIGLLDLRKNATALRQPAADESTGYKAPVNTVVITKTKELGWRTANNRKFYVLDDGEEPETAHFATGFMTIGEKKYYFKANGVMATGWVKDNGKWYYMNANGIMATGWKQIGKKWYYLNPSGVMATGWKKIGSQWYYLNANGIMATGWKKIGNKWYYFKSNGAYVVNKWLRISKKWYCFDKNGVMLADAIKASGKNTYILTDSGAMKETEGWYTINKKKYYTESDGRIRKKTMLKDNSEYYYLKADGEAKWLENKTAAAVAYGMNGDLVRAFRYAGGITYYGRDQFNSSWGSKKLSEYGIRNYQGNCYVYAAVFRELAVCMGYDAHQISGSVGMSGGEGGGHSWVEIDIDGDTFVFDPAGLLRLGMQHAYMFHYRDKGTWVYQNYSRMN